MNISVALAGIRHICIETAPFIYFVERHPKYIDRMRAIFQRLDQGVFECITSAVTVTEVLMKPIHANDKLLENS